MSDTESKSTGSIGGAPAAPVANTPKKPAPPTFHSLAELFIATYSSPFRKLKIKKADLAAMRSAPGIEPTDDETWVSLSVSDRTLERTRELMLLSLECFGGTAFAAQTRQLVRGVLLRHPAFRFDVMTRIFDGQPTMMDENEAVRVVSDRNYSMLIWPQGMEPLTKAEGSQLGANTIHCLLLWLRDINGMPLLRLHRYLNTYLWRPSAKGLTTDAKRIRRLTSTRDRVALAIACAVLEDETVEQRQVAEAAHLREQSAAARANTAERAVADAQTKLSSSEAEVQRLATELQAERQRRELQAAHWNDDHQALKGRLARRIKDEVSLLDEGLHALRRDPPKVDVMADHAERAIDGLKKELKHLKGEES